MIHMVMQKDITAMIELPGNRTKIESWRYKDVEGKLKGQPEVLISYPYGMEKHRLKFMRDLGFVWSSNIFYEPVAIHSIIKQHWVRG
jgi:hypothetical protein